MACHSVTAQQAEIMFLKLQLCPTKHSKQQKNIQCQSLPIMSQNYVPGYMELAFPTGLELIENTS